MAKEYIDREAAKEELLTWARRINHLERIMTEDAIHVLDTLYADDVAPVRHGRWICVDTDDEQFFLCNRCKNKEYWESNYCPNCGCKMMEDLNGKK